MSNSNEAGATTEAAVPAVPAAPAAAAAVPPAEPAAPPADPVAEARRQARAEAEEIVALCAVAGVSAGKAHEFIAQGKSAADVRAALITLRASQAEQTEIVSQLQPQTGTDAGAVAPSDSAIVKACEGLAGRGK